MKLIQINTHKTIESSGDRKHNQGWIQGWQQGHCPPLTQKGGQRIFWSHLSSVFFLRDDPFIHDLFTFFIDAKDRHIYFCPNMTMAVLHKPSSKFPCWKSNRKTVRWIHVWLTISCATGLMLAAFYDNDMFYYQRYFCRIGHRHRMFWVINTDT